MFKPKIGDTIKIISTKYTKPFYGVNPTMRRLIGKKAIVTEICNSPGNKEDYSIKAGGFFWSPNDIQQPKQFPQPKGGTFNTDNLVAT